MKNTATYEINYTEGTVLTTTTHQAKKFEAALLRAQRDGIVTTWKRAA